MKAKRKIILLCGILLALVLTLAACGSKETKNDQVASADGTVSEEETHDKSAHDISIAIGDYIKFGAYPQTSEGMERDPIDWLVLDIQDNKALLISKYGLDAQRYNTYASDVTWETCSLRSWLNNEFMNMAFTRNEQTAIIESLVDNTSSQGFSGWDSLGGNNTYDRIFILSCAEASKYFGVNLKLGEDGDNIPSRIRPTAYAYEQGAYSYDEFKTEDGRRTGWWWLRSPGSQQNFAAYIRCGGSLDSTLVHATTGCVRPSLWVNLDSKIFLSEALNIPFEEESKQDQDASFQSPVSVGEVVSFGSFSLKEAGFENIPIEWQVIDIQGGKGLLVSKYGLFDRTYHIAPENASWHNDGAEGLDWEKSDIREWLNNSFLSTSFNEDERAMILETVVDNSTDQNYGTWLPYPSGNNTNDYIFLLSSTEANTWWEPFILYSDSAPVITVITF